MLVEDLVTPAADLVTCELDTSLQTAAVKTLDHGVGSVIVVVDDDPYSIVTETDAIHAAATDTTVRTAVDRMQDHDIKKLPVVDGVDLRGLVTQIDVTSHYNDFVAEAHALDRRRRRWEEDRYNGLF